MFHVGQLQKDKHRYPVEAKEKEVREVLESSARPNGPGGNHHNLVPLQALASERTVIFYDQLGCGNSDRPNYPSLWKAKRYFEDLKADKNHEGFRPGSVQTLRTQPGH